MSGWKECLLGDVITLKRGYDLPHSARSPGPFPVVSSSGITDHHAEPKVKAPGVVTGRYGTLGQVFFVSKDYWPLNTSLYVQDFKGNDPKFIALLLSTLSLGSQNAAGAVPGVNRNHLHAMEVCVPPLPIQRRIAGILSSYDDLIENSQRRIKILEEMARRLYREWFVDFRFPGHEDCRFVESPLGVIPEGWSTASIDQVCSRVTDGSHFSPKSVDEGLPMASSKDLHAWGLNLDSARRISLEDFEELVRNDCHPLKDDVLITKDGANYLKCIFVVRSDEDVVLLSSVAILRCNDLINPHLLAAILSEPDVKARLSNYVTGAAIPRIVLKDFKRFEILLPPRDVQGVWANIAQSLTKQIWCLIDQIRNLRLTRDLLLPRLLSGQIDIEALSEPAISDS